MKKLIAVVLTATLLLACEKEEGPYGKFNIDVGEQFTIELEANWSTGYAWKWENNQDTTVIDTTGRTYIQTEPGLGGGSGVEEWTFTGKRSGQEEIRFIYLKDNNQDPQPLETREYSVIVSGS